MNNLRVSPFAYILCLIVVLFTLPSCAPYRDLPDGAVKEIGPAATAVVSKEDISVPSLPPETPPAKDYQVGPGDILLIDVNARPEFTVVAPSMNSKVQGSRVDGSGMLHVPMVGNVQVAGLTLSQIEQKLTPLLRKYVQEPWVVVEIADYKSQPVYLVGQFKIAGTYYLDRPLTLAQGVSLGSGFDPTANLRGARLTRGGKIVPVDLYELLMHGDSSQNIWLKGGDSIYIPTNQSQQVFVFGAVKKPGPVPMPTDGMTLAQAIGSADLRDTGYDIHHVRIIRSLSTTRGQLLVVDYERVLRGQALPLQLMEGDVIYVPKSAFGSWNDAIADVLPSLQTIGAILQPFVSIKFLRQ